jgi:hypothetical protein
MNRNFSLIDEGSIVPTFFIIASILSSTLKIVTWDPRRLKLSTFK